MLVRLILYLVFIYVAVRLIKNLFLSMPGERKEKTEEGEDMVMDPNCNTYIPKRDAIYRKVGGQKIYFCSDKCLKEYKAKN